MHWKSLGRLLAPALLVGVVVVSTGSTAEATEACAVPARVPVPATTSVVGSGTAASCTEAALRKAATAGGHVTFSCGSAPVTIPVTSEIKVTKTTVISGGGTITLDGRRQTRILHALMNVTLSVRNLKLLNGGGTATDKGGAIISDYLNWVEAIGVTFEDNTTTTAGGAISMGSGSRLTLIASTLTGNTSASGGAIYSPLTQLTVVNSTLAGNTSTAGVGGAIVTDGAAAPDEPGTIRVCGATFRHNTAHGAGGGGFFWSYAPQTLIIDRTTFDSNTSLEEPSGSGSAAGAARLSVGLTEKHKTGTLIIKNSSVRSNTTQGGGGGFYLDCPSTCDISNTTFYKNSAKDFGGALFGDGHTSNNVTYAYNRAGNQAGAIWGSKTKYYNTIFVGNTSGNPWGLSQTCSSLGQGNHVLQWGRSAPDTSKKCVATVLAKNPRLGTPAANGGSTLSMLPAADSPALNAGTGCLSTDQRGMPRKTSVCDLGSVQRTAVSSVTSAASPVTSAAAKPSATASAAPTSLATPASAQASRAAPATSASALALVKAGNTTSAGPLRSVGLPAVVGGIAIATLLAFLLTRRKRSPRHGAGARH